MKKIIILAFALFFVLSFSTELSFSQLHNGSQLVNDSNENVRESNLNVPEPVYKDYHRVAQITGWDIEIAKYFVSEAEYRGVDVFEKALPIIYVETQEKPFSFDLINYNSNGTTDEGLFQINTITNKEIVKYLKAENREFNPWNRLEPYYNIAAGLFWLGYLQNTYGLEGDSLFTCYNMGVAGGNYYASRNGTYESGYSRKVAKAKRILTDY